MQWLRDLLWLRRRVQSLVLRNGLLVAALLGCRAHKDDSAAIERIVSKALAENRRGQEKEG